MSNIMTYYKHTSTWDDIWLTYVTHNEHRWDKVNILQPYVTYVEHMWHVVNICELDYHRMKISNI